MKKVNFKNIFLLTALSSALYSHMTIADIYPNGKVGAKNNGDGTSTIRIEDPNKIKWYRIYINDWIYRQDTKKWVKNIWRTELGYQHVDVGCKNTTVDITLTIDHLTHNHMVKYGDCSEHQSVETWTDVNHGLWFDLRPGNRFMFDIASNTDETFDINKEVDYKIEDINNDLIPDMVITRKNKDSVGVAVMKGNSDGSFQQPNVGDGTLIFIPQGN